MVFGKILNLLWQKIVPTLAKFSYFVGQIIIVLNSQILIKILALRAHWLQRNDVV